MSLSITISPVTQRVSHVARRRGVTVLVVLALVSIALAMSYAILRSQTTAMQLQTNNDRGNLARQAALAGLSAGMRDMRLNTWGGVSTTLSGNLSTTDSYLVTFLPGDVSLTAASPDYAEYPRRVTVKSTGTSIDPAHAGVTSTYCVQAVMRLIPRGLNPAPSSWSTMMSYTLYQLTNQNIDVAWPFRVEGPVRLQGGVEMADAYNWGNTKRNRYLSDLNTMVSGINEVKQLTRTGATGGTFTMTFNGATTGNIAWNASSATVQAALQALATIGSGNVTVTSGGTGVWILTFGGQLAGQDVAAISCNSGNLTGAGASMNCSATVQGVAGLGDYRPFTGPLSMPTSQTDSENLGLLTSQLALTVNNIAATTTGAPSSGTWLTYRVYRGGPLYNAGQLPQSASNVALSPDPVTNPLGIFYSSSSATLGNNVTVTGTVITGGELAISGTNVKILPYSLPALEGATAPVRLPAVIALGDLRVASGASATINGFLYLAQKLRVDQGSEATALAITGNIVLGSELRIGMRNEWNAYSSAHWDLVYTTFLTQLSLGNAVPYFPQWVSQLLGRSYIPLLTLKPDSTSVVRQWQDFSNPLYVPGSGDTGLHWDLVTWTEGQ